MSRTQTQYGLKFKGRPPVKIAESVKDVVTLKNPYAAAIMDRNQAMDEEFVKTIVAQSIFSYEGRSPTPALDENGDFQGTDLDLLSFLVPIVERGAVIEIPRYRNRRKVVVRENERKVGSNQFGKTTGLISNKEVLSFSVRIWDNTIVVRDPETEKESAGAHRNYMIVDCDGHWYYGWDKIVWNPTAEENKFLTEKKLWTGNAVYFTNYVHPNRWQSFFGAPYLLLKMLIARIDDEAGFYRESMKHLEAVGRELPVGEKTQYTPPAYEGETEPITVQTIEAMLDLSNFHGIYEHVPMTQGGLVQAYRRQKFLTYTLKPLAQFVARADEAAYFRFGGGRISHWMQGRKWDPDWKMPKGRISWNLMVLSNDVALRYRIRDITQRVSAE